MNVLITGALGFLGKNIAKRFASEGHYIIGCGRGGIKNEKYYEYGISKWYEGNIDLSMLSSISEVPELIVHCAGSGSVSRSIIDPYNDFNDSVISTVNILEYARIKAPDALFIYPSSPSVNGLHDNTPISITDPTFPISPYGHHKNICEGICRFYNNAYDQRISIIRFFSVYGKGLTKQLLWDACKKIKTGAQLCFFGTGDETRDYIYIDDAVELVFTVSKKHNTSKLLIFNCGNGVAYSTSYILNELSVLFEIPSTYYFTGIVREGDPMYYLANISESLALGWTPKVKMNDGLAAYVEWFKTLHA